MIPVGYIAKRIAAQPPDWLRAPSVRDVYSVSCCVNNDLVDCTPDLPINGYWLFDSPEKLRAAADAKGVDCAGSRLFYYEACDLEFDEGEWTPFARDQSFETSVAPPSAKHLEGFDIVSFCDGPNSHSPLSCNSIAQDVKTNEHCLFETEDEARQSLNAQAFSEGEPGPYRIYAVYSVAWPRSKV
ncbi:MAG: hypothetical protein V4555_05850 [Acidobacteriota bacterium]